jgi:hypothetical protein
LKFLYENSKYISRYGIDIMNLELDFIGDLGSGLLDLFEFEFQNNSAGNFKIQADDLEYFTKVVTKVDVDLLTQNSEDSGIPLDASLTKFIEVVGAVAAVTIGVEYLVNILFAESFGALNSFMKSLQIIIYASFLFDL